MLYSKKRQSPITHEKTCIMSKSRRYGHLHVRLVNVCVGMNKIHQWDVRGVAQTRFRDVRTCRCMDGQTNAHTYVRRSANLNVHPHWGHKTGIL